MEPSPRVLIVDDDADALKLYGLALELLGCRVVSAASAYDALRAVSAHPPEIVVTDLAMPGMDGIELCEALKASEQTRDIPVLAVSGHALPVFQERALAAGCEEVLLKPCLPEDLFATIGRVLESTASMRGAGAPAGGGGNGKGAAAQPGREREAEPLRRDRPVARRRHGRGRRRA